MSRPRVVRPLAGLCLLALLTATAARGDEPKKKVETALRLLDPMELASVNIETDPFVAWVKPILDGLDKQFASETGPRTVYLLLTLHHDKPADVEFAAVPALGDAQARALRTLADPARSPRSRASDATIRVETKVNGGAKTEPKLKLPEPRWFERYGAAGTARKLEMMRQWARGDAIPLLVALIRYREAHGDKTLLPLGKALAKIKGDGPIDVDALTDRNPDYWRALLKTPVGDPVVPAMKVLLHVANGEIRRAHAIADVVRPFDPKNTGASALIQKFLAMTTPFDKEVQARIQKGIALNDQGKLDEAIKVYDAILKDYPKSSWARYERFHTVMTQGMKEKRPLDVVMSTWPEARKAILDADPLYSTMAEAKGADELYDLLLRKEAEELFKGRRPFVPNMLRYAEIALELGQPGFAALIYSEVERSVDPKDYKNRELTEDTLYCLEKLGVTGLKSAIKGDHAAAFRRIDAERAKRKKAYPGVGKMVVPPSEPGEPKKP